MSFFQWRERDANRRPQKLTREDREREARARLNTRNALLKQAKQENNGSVLADSPLTDPKFYGDLYKNADITARNAAALFLGAPVDLVQGLYDLRTWGDPRMPDIDIPGSAEDFAAITGGDPDHPSWLPSALVTPGPQEVTAMLNAVGTQKAFIAGAIGLGNRVDPVLIQAMFDEKQGATAADIIKKYGVWRGASDGKWRKIFSDAEMEIDYIGLRRRIQEAPTAKGYVKTTLGEAMAHDELFKTYPELKDYPLHIRYSRQNDGNFKIWNPEKPKNRGSFDDRTRTISIENIAGDEPHAGLEEIVMHEVQHAIQGIEGFAKGGSPQMFTELGNAHNRTYWKIKFLEEYRDNKIPWDVEWMAWEDVDEEVRRRWEYGPFREFFNPSTAESLLWGITDEDDILWEIEQLSHDLEIHRIELKAALEALGSKLGPEQLAQVNTMTWSDLAYRYYRGLGGEIESRLVQYLREVPQESLDEGMRATGRSPEELAKTMPKSLGPADMAKATKATE